MPAPGFTRALAVAAGALVVLSDASRAQDARAATDLVTHSEVVIERPAAAIWPHVVDPSAWKRGVALRLHAGRQGTVGAVHAAIDAARPDVALFYTEDVEVVPHRQRTIKLYQPDGTLIGYATWWLREAGGRTTVGYDVYSEFRRAAPATRAAADSMRRADREYVDTNQRRFDEELLGLKRLVESKAAGSN